MTRRAVVLLSGGMDSATCLALAVSEGFSVTAVSFRYGQRHAVELGAAVRVFSATCGTAHKHLIVDLPPAVLAGSALTGTGEVPPAGGDGIPATYVPARNTVFLAMALGIAETRGAEAIYIGANSVDYSGYPDCRGEFLEAFQRMADLATKAGVEGHGPRLLAPLLTLSKAEIIRLGRGLGVDYSLTVSCYDPAPDGAGCEQCDSCALRAMGFREADKAVPRG